MIVQYAEKTQTRRFASKLRRPRKQDLKTKSLKVLLVKHAGRSHGRVTVRHQGGRHKRYYRLIDFKRSKFDVSGKVVGLEYDPNRNVDIACIQYEDGERRYILAPAGVKTGDLVISSRRPVEIKAGNSTALENLPVGTVVHNVELAPGKGGQIGRSAGAGLTLQAKEAGFAHLKMPSGEIRMIPLKSQATVGVLGNEDWKNINLGKAGRSRHMGIRPTVRGTAQDPDSHPHGGGEARSGVGRKRPMTKYGKPAVGKTRKINKWTSKFLVKRRS